MNLGLKLHETLRDRALITLHLRPITPLHVGRGGAEFLNEIVQFDVNGRTLPIIPSESIKGVMRSLATRLATHITFPDPDAEASKRYHRKDVHEVEGEELKEIEVKAEGLRTLFEPQQWDEVKDGKVELYLSIHCPICRLFGSRHIAGKLLFHDGIPTAEAHLSTYTGISINRETRTIEKGRLFKIQYIVPTNNLCFRTVIIADNIKGTPEAKLLALLLESIINEGLKLGGQKSRGFGLMELERNRESEVKYVEFNTEPVNNNEKLENIRKMLFEEGYYKSLELKDFINMLR
jgi:CRISPR/Cas system CSM-associated protein Csm3 (group 7 of RAMP superfamily)